MPEKLRLRFEKTGRAIYISHLDLMRTMQRVFLRADCPLKYSEGFNPHALISILLPLSVGVGSGCELMDFQLREDVDLAALPERLTAVMPEGIRALEAYPAGRKVRELKCSSSRRSWHRILRPLPGRRFIRKICKFSAENTCNRGKDVLSSYGLCETVFRKITTVRCRDRLCPPV